MLIHQISKKGIVVATMAIIAGAAFWFVLDRRDSQEAAPDGPNHLEQARNASSAGDFAKAEEEYEKAFETGAPTAKEWSELAYVYQMEQKKDEAVSAYENAVKDGLGSAGALNNLGNLYRDLGRYDKAEEYYKKSIAASNNFSVSVVNLSHLYNIQQKYDESVKLLLEHYDGTKAKNEIGLQLITTYRSRGEPDRAKKVAQALLDADPDNKQAAAIISQL